MDDQRAALTERIAYAEDWLARARRHVDDGHQTRGVLTLMLAEAEVHRARELGAVDTGQASGPASKRSAGVALAVATVVIGMAFGAWRIIDSGALAGFAAPRAVTALEGSAPHIVTLSVGTGALLGLVQAREAPVERVVTVPMIVRMEVPQMAARAPFAASARVAQAPPAAAPAAPASPRHAEVRPVAATVQPPPAVAEPSTLLSEAELIDLVLAAERSLRRSANQ